ncbi:MAG TPA: amidase family protein, partial [Polyangiaceae bacterium]|nr:amidase family protein [Polyangiaceae bacterium]
MQRLSITPLVDAFTSGASDPSAFLDDLYERIAVLGVRPIWISLLPRERAQELLHSALARRARGESLPLLGVPFAIKDNIDLAGAPTTAACPEFAYTPATSAT